MRRLALVAALAACGKHAPHSLDTGLAITKALDGAGVTLKIYSAAGDKLMADGTFTLAITSRDGSTACQGSTEITKTAYNEVEKTVAFDQPLAGCPPYQAGAFHVISRFLPAGAKTPIENTYELDALHPADPPAPGQRRNAALDKACAAGDRARADKLRAEVADQVTHGAQVLQPPLRDAVAALLADKDPCKRTFGVYARDLALDDKPDWEIKFGGADTFGDRVRACHWPEASAVADELARRLADLGGGWLQITRTLDDRIPGVAIQYTVSTDGKIRDTAATVTLAEEVGLLTPIPGQATPLVPLVIEKFSATGSPTALEPLAAALSAKVDLMSRLAPGDAH